MTNLSAGRRRGAAGYRQSVIVVLPGCPSRHEPARSQGFQIPADNFPYELARV